ncbi:GDP-mannose-dependent alpha-(1-6)-phosphatidylinositol monomannoside mannosyltransferase [Rubripirellula lacrimiformis]|uniref:GDP-mannose-dependent alpha-(1-6)-phosphatidylinositol monomannoside mannosyltransferase n=1 Tax=Rubripirellula lacrimiformis TaxID=1930273 RepID=A0A517NJT3_9BACT|nr:glycosyltransferase family 1 protein [Rubripirellula lacrimiformis]QDT07303.1 GDP-mannose-dependent alpha-(1-6)-phosphatidylinositol monomannoside mannosyltransferase [Rubripirellula lacrimiformis]
MAKPSTPSVNRRVLIDGTKLADSRPDGIRRYVSGLLGAMVPVAAQHEDWAVDVHLGSRIIPISEIGPWLDVRKKAPETVLQFFRQRVDGLRVQVQRMTTHYDVVHLTMPNTFCAFRGFKGRRLVTVHDLSHLACPQWQTTTNSESLERGLQDAVQRDARFTTVSDFVRKELATRCGISSAHETGAGCDRSRFHSRHSVDAKRAVRTKYSLPDAPFLLSVGTLEPRKNLLGTVRAYRQLLESNPQTTIDLVIVGHYGWGDLSDVHDAAKGCDRIHWIGGVPDDDLPLIYAQAEALSYVSHYEGFGLPALESMNCGVPVVYGSGTAVAEVVADAGWAADPNSTEQIFHCFREVATRPDIRQERSDRAIRRSEQFGWSRVAEAMWDQYTAVAECRVARLAG